MKLTLASGSPRRRELLALLVDDFDLQSPDVDETFPPGPVPTAMEAVALRKADAVASKGVVLAADTAVLVHGAVLGKPSNREEARSMLAGLQGRPQRVVTAVVVSGPTGTTTFHVATSVRLQLPDDVLEQYLESREWNGKAGGYGLQDALIAPHATIDGPWSNVVGLPLQRVCDALTAAGIACREPPSEDSLRTQNPF